MKYHFSGRSIGFLILVLVALVLGIVAFQGTPTPIRVEGYLDAGHRLYYAGGIVPDSDKTFFVEPTWHGNNTSLSDIEYYVQASHAVGQQLLEQGVNQFYVGVTFRRYLSPSEFEAFATQTGVEVKNYMLRATFPRIDPDSRVGMYGAPSGGRIINPESLQRALESHRSRARTKLADKIAAARSGNPHADAADVLDPAEVAALQVVDSDAVINGVFTFEAVTDAQGYWKLLNDPRVYHIDVTATLVYQQIKDRGITWDQFVREPNLGDYDPFYVMESIGLAQFESK